MTVDFRQRDRLESLKAGLVGAGALVPTELLLLSLRWFQCVQQNGALLDCEPLLALVQAAYPSAWAILFHLGETALAGFLFGVTYRYAIRQDTNPQLKAGTFLAFALVRGLGQVDAQLHLGSDWRQWVEVGVESAGLFAIATLLLNVALQRGWIAIAPGSEPDTD